MPPTRVVLLDALGTLVELEPPSVHLRAALGDAVPEQRIESAVRAEIRYYREHSDEGRDPESLADLRRRCAAVLSRELGVEVSAHTLIEAIRFRPYPDATPALRFLRRRGVGAICVSNWDCSLPGVLERCGLAGLLAGVVPSAVAGARKPSSEIFARALELAGRRADEALHVGDTPDEDIAGARSAGIRAVLIDRRGAGCHSGGSDDPTPRISSLDEIHQYLQP